MTLVPRFFDKKTYSFFLFGPRGTGKSTWLRKLYPKAMWVDLLEDETYRQFSARPSRLTEFVDGAPVCKTFVIDEIQRIPALLPVIHALMESRPGVQFILTGSSARKLKRAGNDLLAGRAIEQHLHPFMASELKTQFDLEQALLLGMVPLIRQSKDPAGTLRSYISLYIREEVKEEGLVRQVDGFLRFLEAVSFSHGGVLSITDISRECQVKRNTAAAYIEMLEDLLLAQRVPVFRKRAKRATTIHPKFYLFDCGVYRSLRPSGPLDRPEEMGGASLEGLVYQHLRAWCNYSEKDAGIFYWRTKAGSEVDFIIYGTDVFFAIEVKHSASIRPKDLRPLKTFLSDYPEAKGLFLYRGKERLKKGNILCLPVQDFLMQLVPNKPLWNAFPNSKDP